MRLQDMPSPLFPLLDSTTPFWERVRNLTYRRVEKCVLFAGALIAPFAMMVDFGVVELKIPMTALFLMGLMMVLAGELGWDVMRNPKLFVAVFPLSFLSGLILYAGGGTLLSHLLELVGLFEPTVLLAPVIRA